MAYTQAEVDALKSAIARGVRKVVFMAPGGLRREVEYASIGEMLKAVAVMEVALAASPYGRSTVAQHSRD